MIRPGDPAPLGATLGDDGINFAVFSSVAEKVELCLFGENGEPAGAYDLPARTGDVWHGFLPGCRAGQRYGFRVHGPWAPEHGLRCNPAKLLLDPYARALSGEFRWHEAVFDYALKDGAIRMNHMDSAPHVPRSVVRAPAADALPAGPRIPWAQTIFYEANVRGFTMRHPAIDDASRGTFDGLRHIEVLDYLKALGITSLELMPVHAFIDERHLARLGLRNFWGYNTIAFFAPAPRYGSADPVGEFRDMVGAIHDAGIEVILDVVYNHTGEGDAEGPTLNFRGLDNLAYYRTKAGYPGSYVNDTGTGNTIDADHPEVQNLVTESLCYWHKEMGVDGFRFDLAPVLGRCARGFSGDHPLLERISAEPRLGNAKLVAEPWDAGPGGYQLGRFPRRWAEWNDRYRDTVRRFWRGDPGTGADLAGCIRGSAAVFEGSKRGPNASVNLITSHDGFTLTDVVSYRNRHNQANGEGNRDGHSHNFSENYGVEGPTYDPEIRALRRQQRLNMLATLMLSQGTPLLLAGDEFGNSQAGNNNAYAQDNEIGWLDWAGLERDPEFLEEVRTLIRLRRHTPLLHLPEYVHGRLQRADGEFAIAWLRHDGQEMGAADWHEARAFAIVVTQRVRERLVSAASLVLDGGARQRDFRLPAIGVWRLAFASSADAALDGQTLRLPGPSIACAVLEPAAG